MTERKRKSNLRPVREVTAPTLEFRTIHGYRRAYRIAGSGPAILLLHGIGDNSTTWNTVQAKLAQRFTVIAPDLLGHGKSDKPRADYSAAAYANGMRDLLSVLDIERVTIIGHSLGGGVAMQFAYQFPHLVDRLILVAAGGVTKDVNVVFRLASLPWAARRWRCCGCPSCCRRFSWRASWPGWRSGQPRWATTCPTCCASSTTCRSRRPRRRSAAPCGRWWTGAGRS
jgi:pimeloyl-ACP methyl ester carboxylesterase